MHLRSYRINNPQLCLLRQNPEKQSECSTSQFIDKDIVEGAAKRKIVLSITTSTVQSSFNRTNTLPHRSKDW
ncbi:MAG: hypothetical protein ACK5N9_04330 [Pirellula sp.]